MSDAQKIERDFSRPFLVGLFSFLLYFALPYPWLFQYQDVRAHWPALLGYLAISGMFAIWLSAIGRFAFEGTRKHAGIPDLIVIAVFAVIYFSIQLRDLDLPFAVAGDEDFHLERGLVVGYSLRDHFPFWIFFSACGIALIMRLIKWPYRRLGAIVIVAAGIVIAGGVIGNTMSESYLVRFGLKRYPPAGALFHSALPFIFPRVFFSEVAWRISSCLAIIAFSALPCIFMRARNHSRVDSLVALVVTAFIPLGFVYASVLALEPVMIFIQGLVIFRLMRVEPSTDDERFRIALLGSCAGLVKETALPFLIALAIGLAISSGRRWKIGMRLAAVTMIPSIPYLLVRTLASPRADKGGGLANFLDGELYRAIFAVFSEQATPLIVLFGIAGIVILFRASRTAGITAALSLGGYLFLYTTDVIGYAGLSRFSLCYLPPLAAGCAALYDKALGRFRTLTRVGAVTAGLWILSTLPLSDAARESWIIPGTDPSRAGSWSYYPYPEAAAKLARVQERFVLAGGVYPYPPFENFYVKKFGIADRFGGELSHGLSVSEAAAECRQKGATLVLYHVDLPGTPPSTGEGFRHIERFELGSRALDLYKITVEDSVALLPSR